MHYKYHSLVSKYTMKRNKSKLQGQYLQKAVETVKKNEKKLREADFFCTKTVCCFLPNQMQEKY